MKAWLLIGCILVIFAIVCSPVLAISKLELIAFYKGEPAPDMSVGVVIINYTTLSPTPTPTPYIPSAWAIPTPVPSSEKSYFPSWFIPSSQVSPSIYPTPTPTPTPVSTPSVLNTCPPDIPIDELHFGRIRYTDGTYLYGAVDDSGAKFRVGKGCPCNCTYYDLNAGWDVVKTAPCDSLFK
jgi:hypothetical protein